MFQTLHSWFALKPSPARRPTSARLGLEVLEQKIVPTVSASVGGGVLVVTGDDANDTITIRHSTDFLGPRLTVDGLTLKGLPISYRGASSIRVDAGGGNDRIELVNDGTTGVLIPTEIDADGGNDTVLGSGGADAIFGGTGNDLLQGRGGNDYIDAGSGADTITGDGGFDKLYGDTGNDTVLGGSGSDEIVGGAGTDCLFGDADPDWIDGGANDDVLVGGTGYDFLYDEVWGTSVVDDSGGYTHNWSHFAWYDMNLGDEGVRSVARFAGVSGAAIAGTGTLSRTEMMDVFAAARDGATITQLESDDLRELVQTSAVAMPEHVRNLSRKVVLSDPANAMFQGDLLGNFTTGTTGSTRLVKLVDKWFLGKDHPLADSTSPDAANPAQVVTTTFGYDDAISEKLYVANTGVPFGSIHPTDVIQSTTLGDCYYLASLAALAQQWPVAISGMFIDNKDGTYTVRFYKNGDRNQADYVTVDRWFPVKADGSLAFASEGKWVKDPSLELWVPLAQKAYVQMAESGWLKQTALNSYAAIAGGFNYDALRFVTGGWVDEHYLPQSLFLPAEWVRDAIDQGKAVASGGYGHAYAVLDVFQVGGVWTVRLFNPWNSDKVHLNENEDEDGNLIAEDDIAFSNPSDSANDDGIIQLRWTEFVKLTEWVSICNPH